MLALGAVSNPREMLSSLQPLQPVNANAAAAGIGVSQFLTDGAAPPAATSGVQSATPAPGATSQRLLSPDVLGFLIWNQGQQSGSAPSTASGTNPATTDGASSTPTTAATGGTDQSDLASWPAFPSWFPPLNTDGAVNIDALGPNNSAGSSGTAATPTATSQSNTNADPVLAAGQPDAAPESSGVHGHHHHGGFAPQSQSGASDPFANLFGTSTQDGSSTTATNADGSTTTTITYADGSEVTLMTPAQASNGNAIPVTAAAQPPLNSNNFLETLIQLQARLLAPTAAA